jgi:type IV secretory pathway VirB2 component (pilin)
MNKKSYWKILLCALLLMAAAAPLFAQTDIMPEGLQSLADNILKIFTGNFVRVILIICLAGCAVAYGFNKDNEKMKRNIIAIAVAIAIIVGAQTIVKNIWDAAGK